MKEILALILVVLALCGIGTFTIGNGVSDAIRSGARQRAARAAQFRQQRAEWHRLEIRRAREVLPYRIAASQMAWYWWSMAATGAGIVLIVAATGAGAWWVTGISRAKVERAGVEARMIRIDPTTRQFPLLTYELGGMWRVYNPNTGSIVCLETGRDEVPLLVQGSAAVQLAGAIAEKAAPETAAEIRPLLLDHRKDQNHG